jgi:hypothetical protein
MSKRMAHWSTLALAGMLALVLGGAAMARPAAGPTITSVSPTSGSRGTSVTIQGSNLQGATVTWVGTNPAAQGSTSGAMKAAPIQAVVSADGTEITFSVPDGGDTSNGIMAPAGLNHLTITTPEGSANATFTVTSVNQTGLKPVITQLMPKRAAPGAQITIFGHHFSGATLVKLGGMKATFKIPSDSRILVKVPTNAHSGTWTVRTRYGTALSGVKFTVSAGT